MRKASAYAAFAEEERPSLTGVGVLKSGVDVVEAFDLSLVMVYMNNSSHG